MTLPSQKAAADLVPGDLVRLDRNSGWREVGSVQVKYHVRIDGSLYYLSPDDVLEVPRKPTSRTEEP